MSNVLSTRWHVAGARMLGVLIGGIVLCVVLISFVKPHQWLALRQAIPVGMSLADAEHAFSSVSDASKQQIEVIDQGAESLSDASQSPTDRILDSLRKQAASLKTLEGQYGVLEPQLEIYKEAFETELMAWTDECEQLTNTAARLDAQMRILMAQAKFDEQVEKAERELRFIKNVIDEGADIKRLVAMADHEATINRTLQSMDTFSSEVHSFATKLQSTTKSVLTAWVNRS